LYLLLFKGTDIPDVEQVLQLSVPGSLTIWMQRAGWVGHSGDVQAHAILLVEPSVFEVVKRADEDQEDPGGLDNEDGGTEVEFRKKVEAALREWVETTICRWDVADRYFGCPSWTRKGTYL
jgi:superfamily II DNA helicase RecQ